MIDRNESYVILGFACSDDIRGLKEKPERPYLVEAAAVRRITSSARPRLRKSRSGCVFAKGCVPVMIPNFFDTMKLFSEGARK